MRNKRSFMKTPIQIFLLFVIFMSGFGTFIYHSTAAVMKRQMGNRCLGIATAVSVIIEQDTEGYLTFCRTLDTDSEYYRDIKGQLEKIRYANDDNLRFLYTEIRLSDTEMMYVLDGERADARLYSPPGSTDLLTVTRRAAYESQAAYVGETFTKNDYGWLLSAYAPIYDSSGHFIGLAGVDVSREQYDEVMQNLLYIIIVSLVILSLMMVALSILLNRIYNEKLRSDQENLSKSTFLARMSHEIRTPMNAIMGMSELMLRENLTAAVREQAVSIRHASANLLAIINDILDFSKIESGRMEIVEAPYQFSSVINDVISIIRMRLTDKPVLFVSNIDSKIPNDLIGDEVRLEQILLNVLSNAVKYTNEGCIYLSVKGELTDEHTVMLTVRVADQGIGIKEKDLDMIFGDFTQADLETNRHVEGTGLGLAITRSLCQAMGGDITVLSTYGEGSVFTVTLPQRFDAYIRFAEVEHPEQKSVLIYESRDIYADSLVSTIEDLEVPCDCVNSHSLFLEALNRKPYSHVFVSSFLYDSTKRIIERLKLDTVLVLLTEYGETIADSRVCCLSMPVHAIGIANLLNGAYDAAKYHEHEDSYARFIAPDARVLVVDDVKTNLSVAKGLLSPFRMQIDCAVSGSEAISLIMHNRYDLVLMDHMMPEMDGIETTAKIREMGKDDVFYRDLPIVALTANAVVGIREMFLQNGMDDFIAKPIENAKLYSVIEKWIPKEKRQKVTDMAVSVPDPGSGLTGLDINAGIAMTGGDLANYRHILAIFQRDSAEKREQIRACLEQNDIALFTTYVHALKSASASVGALDIAEQAKRLEQAGRKEDTGFIRQNCELFLQDLDVLQEQISAYLDQTAGDLYGKREAAGVQDKELLARPLTALKEALAVIDIEAMDKALVHLQTITWNDNLQKQLNHLYQLVLLFEYEEAAGVIDALLLKME